MPTKPKAHNHAKLIQRRDQYTKDYNTRRGTSRERGYSHAWSKYSKGRIRQHPLCARCKAKGWLVRATVTDHIKPARWFPELFDDETNHQSLCTACNAVKSREDERKYVND